MSWVITLRSCLSKEIADFRLVWRFFWLHIFLESCGETVGVGVLWSPCGAPVCRVLSTELLSLRPEIRSSCDEYFTIWANDSVGKNKGGDTTTRTELQFPILEVSILLLPLISTHLYVRRLSVIIYIFKAVRNDNQRTPTIPYYREADPNANWPYKVHF